MLTDEQGRELNGWLQEQYEYYKVGSTTSISESATGMVVIKDVQKALARIRNGQPAALYNNPFRPEG